MNIRTRSWGAKAAAVGAVLALGLTACSSGDSTPEASGTGGEEVGVTIITKTSTNPFFVSMTESAQKAADKLGVNLQSAAGKKDGDEATQVQAIENAISSGQKGILITPTGPGVNSAIQKARDAGLYVIALDTVPDPADIVDITFATDNFEAGKLIGQWTAGTLNGKDATIAMLDLFNDTVVSVDVARDTGFLTGMGIDVPDLAKNASEAPTGNYSKGKYTIVCHEPTDGAEEGGRTAMENCLTKNENINVVYTINEPAAAGAYAALKAAGKEKDVTIVSVDGGCPGVQSIKDGVIGATSMQFPLLMASLGVEAIVRYANDGSVPAPTEGKDFYNTGVTLITDEPVDGLESQDSTWGLENCWG